MVSGEWIWVNYSDLTATSLEILVSKGNHPQMGELFRFVNYYNLPRYHEIEMMDVYTLNFTYLGMMISGESSISVGGELWAG